MIFLCMIFLCRKIEYSLLRMIKYNDHIFYNNRIRQIIDTAKGSIRLFQRIE